LEKTGEDAVSSRDRLLVWLTVIVSEAEELREIVEDLVCDTFDGETVNDSDDVPDEVAVDSSEELSVASVVTERLDV
jgi:hypothetical protein